MCVFHTNKTKRQKNRRIRLSTFYSPTSRYARANAPRLQYNIVPMEQYIAINILIQLSTFSVLRRLARRRRV